MTVSLEQASRCPRCEKPAPVVRKYRGPAGSTIHLHECHNERCRWHGTRFIVQILRDGSIPERGEEPAYNLSKPHVPDELIELHRDYIRKMEG